MLANSSARRCGRAGFLGAGADVVLERDPCLGRGLHVLVGFDEPDQQRVDQHVVRRAFARKHLGEAMPAARVIEVGALPARGAFAPILSALITRPQRRSFICGHTSRVSRTAANSFWSSRRARPRR